MADTPDVETVETEDEYVHVRFRDPDRYDEIRTWIGRRSPPSPSRRTARSEPEGESTTGR